MKKILGSIVVMIVASFISYVPAAKADYLVRMDDGTYGFTTFLYGHNLSGAVYESLWGMNQHIGFSPRPNSWSEEFLFSTDYRDNATAYMLSLTPRNDIYSNCFPQGSEWRIEIFDRDKKVLATYTHRATPGTPPEWGTIFNVPLSVVNKARTINDVMFIASSIKPIQLIVAVTPRKGARSPLPSECIRSITWMMLMPDWTHQWLGVYTRYPF